MRFVLCIQELRLRTGEFRAPSPFSAFLTLLVEGPSTHHVTGMDGGAIGDVAAGTGSIAGVFSSLASTSRALPSDSRCELSCSLWMLNSRSLPSSSCYCCWCPHTQLGD